MVLSEAPLQGVEGRSRPEVRGSEPPEVYRHFQGLLGPCGGQLSTARVRKPFYYRPSDDPLRNLQRRAWGAQGVHDQNDKTGYRPLMSPPSDVAADLGRRFSMG